MKFDGRSFAEARSAKCRDEMAFHIESKTRELVGAGMSETDARFEARRRFGSVLKQKEAGHEIRVGPVLRRCPARRPRDGPRTAQKPGLHARGRAHARARHRRQHRDLFHRRSGAAAAAAVPARRQAGHGVRASGLNRRKQRLAGELAGLAEREPHARGICGLADAVGHADRSRGGHPAQSAGCVARILFGASRRRRYWAASFRQTTIARMRRLPLSSAIDSGKTASAVIATFSDASSSSTM